MDKNISVAVSDALVSPRSLKWFSGGPASDDVEIYHNTDGSYTTLSSFVPSLDEKTDKYALLVKL